jgi:hypothetical protein
MVIGREDEPTMVGESKFVCEEIVSEWNSLHNVIKRKELYCC